MNANGHTDVLAFMSVVVASIIAIGAVVLPLSGGAWQTWLALGLFLVTPLAFAARSAQQLHRIKRRP